MKERIYMDYAATTPVDERVLEAMLPFFRKKFGNAASKNHSFGWEAEEAVENARRLIADLIGAQGKEIIFTSGSTESNNLAIQGVAEMYRKKGNHIISCVTEHKAVLDPCHFLKNNGFDVTFLEVNEYGLIDLKELEDAITDKTILISLMAVNNETGVIFPVEKIGQIAKMHKVLFHTDATQACGKIPVNVEEMGIDLLSLSGHKIYAPKGVGALYVRRKNPRVRLSAQMHGGGHERGIRPGTLNVPSIVGLGAACFYAKNELEKESLKLWNFRNRFFEEVTKEIDLIKLNGHKEKTVPGIVNISFNYVEGESLMMGMDGIAVSSGSACTSANLEPSYVLRSLGVGDEAAHSSIRFSFGRFTTEEELEKAIKILIEAVNRLRKLSPAYQMLKDSFYLNTIQRTGN